MMIEPLTVRVERIRGQNVMPIPLPVPDGGGAPGTGYDKGLILGLEQWLQAEWCGGGMLRVTVTDSTTPKPETMQWTFVSNVPEKTPPPLVGHAPEPIAKSVPQQPQPMQVPMAPPTMNYYPNGLPPGVPPAPTSPAPTAQPAYWYPPPAPQYAQGYQNPAMYNPGWAAQQQLAQAQQTNVAQSRTHELEAQIAGMQKQLAERDYNAKLEAEKHANDLRFKRIEDGFGSFVGEIKNLVQTLATPKPAGESPEIAALKAALEEQKAATARAEADRRDRELRDEMRRQQEQSLQVQREMTARFESIIAQINAKPTGPDPLIAFMQENMRIQNEVAKEAQRNGSDILTKIQPYMMTPRDLIAMQRDTALTSEERASQMGRAYGEMMNIQTRMMEQLANLQPGGKSGLDLVDGMAEKVAGWMETWSKGKAGVERAQLQAQAAQADAQARAIEAQSAAVRAQYAAAGRSGLGEVTTEAPQPSNVVRMPPRPVPTPAPTPQPVADPNEPRRGGRTDAEWFGPALDDVKKLRDGVKRALESVSMTDAQGKHAPRMTPEGLVDGIVPEQVALYVNQASAMTKSMGVAIPAMIDLYEQLMYADFVEILLGADVPQAYKDEVIRYLASDGTEDEDEDEGDEDDGDDQRAG